MNKKNEIKAGVVLSYLLLVINTVYGLLIAPYILKYVGVDNYGVYKTIAALSASLAVLDLGLGSTLTRYMAKYNATGDKNGASNFVAMIFIQFAIIAFAILCIGAVFFFGIDSMYGKTFSSSELKLAKQLMVFLLLNMVLRLFENLLSGIASGHECFTAANGVKVLSVVVKFSLILVLLPIVNNILLVVMLETVVVTAGIVFFYIYTVKHIGIVPKLTKWNKEEFKESFGYTALMFIQTLTTQFNGNVDNILIGSMVGAASVTVYSMSLTIFGMYENLSGSIANLMLPRVTKKVVAGDSPEQLQKSVEKAGRWQFVLLAAALGGFIVLGKDFYMLWLGKEFLDCYYLTLILIVPVTVPMMQNVCLSVLRAQNRMLYRTVTLGISCVINVGLTIIGIKLFGYWGAAIGTAGATLSNILFMNFYYKKKLGFGIFRMFKNIIGKTAICACIAAGVTYAAHLLLYGTWVSFIANAAVFMVVYLAMLFVIGISKSEREGVLIKLHLKRGKE
ncbi:MAG: oligosaccharide flippase family protein [Clostridia bacterium]|nr:oligosaccharide flippase family protein [Clostridia bacterium]